MASKAKEVAVKEKEERDEAPPIGAAETTDTLLPLLDLSDAAVKRLIRIAKKHGHVTHDQVKSLSDGRAMFSEMGVNVVEHEEAADDDEKDREEADEEPEAEGGELVEVRQKVPAKSEAKEPTDRTDDPVRMYLREMGSVELLSRAGEIAIAKRIEAGREAMIAALCESPLTFQGIIIWRDELSEGKVFLRDIIDVEATYTGPDAKNTPMQVIGPDGQPVVPQPGAVSNGQPALAQIPTPPSAPATATPFKPAAEGAGDERTASPKASSTTTTWKTRSRLPPSSRSSSPRWSKPSTTSPTPTSGCASCRNRSRSRPRRSAATRGSRARSLPR